MAASASELPSVARTMAVPNATEVTVNETVVCPAGTITEGGTVTRPLGVLVRVTTVGPTWAAEIATVNGVVAPSVSWFAGGVSETTVGKAGVTVTWLVALVPLRVAVMSA